VAISLRAVSWNEDPSAPGVILGIDYGKRRLGLALSDEFGVTSRPYATWTRVNRRRDLAVRRIVVGLPLRLDGAPSEMSLEARSFAARVEKALGIRVEMVDERLTSWEARETHEATNFNERARPSSSGREEKKKKAAFDEIAAAIILRDYLDQIRTRRGSRA
jgi:putative Holliday junction resolvase